MPDYRTLFDSNWIRAWDLGGKARVLKISKVVAGTLEDHRSRRKEKKPVLHFANAGKPLALNKTNAKVLAAMYGNNTDDWVGKTITVYPTTTSFGNDTVDCIRIKPQQPTGPVEKLPDVEPPKDRQPGEDDQ